VIEPPENKGGQPGKPEPKSKMGVCEYCDFPQELRLKQIVVHGVRYWACEPCRRMAEAMDEED
jgi:hypothetical protein